jgi:TrmH family RNA methyltransferase
MLTKNNAKRINSLRVKKFRNELGLFVAEGDRLVNEIMGSSLDVVEVYHTSKWATGRAMPNAKLVEVSDGEMRSISGLESPPPVIALVRIPEYSAATEELDADLCLALDEVQDPGNLGTIIRLADWFGVEHIICSQGTVDAFSPKVVQASMGAIARVKIIYCDLASELEKLRARLPIYGTFMDGENIYKTTLTHRGIIVMGNEGNGIGPTVEKRVTHRLHIPNFAVNRASVESLNVAMATAVVLSEFRRRL